MNRITLICLILISLFACKEEQSEPEPEEAKRQFSYSLESVELAFDITTMIESGQEVSDQQWDALFDSKGYQTYFCAFERAESAPRIKDCFYMVFDEDRSAELDSVLQAPVPYGPSGRYPMIIKNLNSFKQNRGAVERFIAETDLSKMMETANAQTLQFLPADKDYSKVELFELNFALIEPNAYVLECGLVVDLNNAYNMGAQELKKLIAHEFHHNYRNQGLSIAANPLMWNLNDLQGEGIADLIDKEVPPVERLGPFPQEMVDMYNELYASTPDKLKTLDGLTMDFLTGRTAEEDYHSYITRFFPDGGHANGYYMSLKIKDAGLEAQMINSMRDPVAFIEIYNQAVKDQEGEHVFSDEFINYIKQLQEEYLQKMENSNQGGTAGSSLFIQPISG